MNSKIILSLMVIGVVGAIAISGTTALFNSQETIAPNTITAGTIDLAVSGMKGQNIAEGVVAVADMKPCQTEYAQYVIQNTGNNPENIFKKIAEIIPAGEQLLSLYGVINYDMSVWVYKTDPRLSDVKPVWWQVIYTEEMKKKLNDPSINNTDVLLGMLPAGWFMKVEQSYNLDCTAGNEYQGKSVSFGITLTGEQLVNTVTLDNKIFPDGEEPTFVYDKTLATVQYDVKDKTFNYKMIVDNGDGFLANGEYTLIAWPENGQEFAWADSANAIALANITIDGSAQQTIENSIDLNRDLINAKLWLIHGTYTPGSATGAFGWNTNGLFETALMDYYDSLK